MGQCQHGLRSPPWGWQEQGELAQGRAPELRGPLEGKVAAGHLSLRSASWTRGSPVRWRVLTQRPCVGLATDLVSALTEDRRLEVATGSLLPSSSASCCPPVRAACQEGISRSEALRTPIPPLPQNPCPGRFMKEQARNCQPTV